MVPLCWPDRESKGRGIAVPAGVATLALPVASLSRGDVEGRTAGIQRRLQIAMA